MSMRLALLQRALPNSAKVLLLNKLARATADGFGVMPPEWVGCSFGERLAEYARFTAGQAEVVLSSGDETLIASVKERLRSATAGLATLLRRVLGVRSTDQAFAALQSLYGRIGIEIAGAAYGEITIGRCFFADYYSESVCRVVEALDQGLITGLFAGASFRFSERLTGGRPCCRALLQPAQSSG